MYCRRRRSAREDCEDRVWCQSDLWVGLGLSPKQSRHGRALDRAADHGFGLAGSANIYLCVDFCEEEKPDPRGTVVAKL